MSPIAWLLVRVLLSTVVVAEGVLLTMPRTPRLAMPPPTPLPPPPPWARLFSSVLVVTETVLAFNCPSPEEL